MKIENTVDNYLADPLAVKERDVDYYNALHGGMWFLLRYQRNQRLEESDPMMVPDRGLSESKLTEWKTYRQELRDLPSVASPSIERSSETDPTDFRLCNVTWPTKPE